MVVRANPLAYRNEASAQFACLQIYRARKLPEYIGLVVMRIGIKRNALARGYAYQYIGAIEPEHTVYRLKGNINVMEM